MLIIMRYELVSISSCSLANPVFRSISQRIIHFFNENLYDCTKNVRPVVFCFSLRLTYACGWLRANACSGKEYPGSWLPDDISTR